VLVDELLVVGDEGLGDGLTDGVDLGGVATAGDADADVEVGELVEADDEEGLVDLEAEDLRLNELQRTAVDLDEALASLFRAKSALLFLAGSLRIATWHRSRRPPRSPTNLALGDSSSRLLLAEALHALGCRRHDGQSRC